MASETSVQEILSEVRHRPWALPEERWVMKQSWHDLLFAHWPVSEAVLRSLIPIQLAIDTFQGQAWLGIVPFHMSGVRLRGMPAVPWLSTFAELNVRTYVVAAEKPGVWFLSLDAGNPIAVTPARAWFHLPYFRAQMECRESDGWLDYVSRRTHRRAPKAEFQARYRPIGEVRVPQTGTLEHWLTERYCLYAPDGRGGVLRGEIHHEPWPVQTAEARIERNTMASAAGIELPTREPLLHFARRQDVLVWAPRQLR